MNNDTMTFEEWAISKGYDLTIGRCYEDERAYYAYEGWQAASLRHEKELADCQKLRDEWCAEYTKLRDSSVKDMEGLRESIEQAHGILPNTERAEMYIKQALSTLDNILAGQVMGESQVIIRSDTITSNSESGLSPATSAYEKIREALEYAIGCDKDNMEQQIKQALTLLPALKPEPVMDGEEAQEIIEHIWSVWYGKHRGAMNSDQMSDLLNDVKRKIAAMRQPKATDVEDEANNG